MRLPNSDHDPSQWRISEVVPDFRLEDLWALPAHGEAGDFALLLDAFTDRGERAGGSRAAEALFAIRLLLGRVLGWDDTEPLPIPGTTERSLSERLPDDLRGTVDDTRIGPEAMFVPLFRTGNEWAAEISNKTVHAVLHLGWVEEADGRFGGQMRVYVKPRGRFGSQYMALIAPFRYHIVYPAMLGQIERTWTAKLAQRVEATG